MTKRQQAREAPLANITEVMPAGATPKVDLDEMDVALLRELTADARQSQRGLARAVGMSPAGVADRITRLEQQGVIRGYRVDIDYAALGYPSVVYLAVTAAPGVDLSQVVLHLREVPEVESMTVVTGAMDLLVRLRVQDHTYLRKVLLDNIFKIPGIQRTETFLSLAEHETSMFAAGLLDKVGPAARADQAQ